MSDPTAGTPKGEIVDPAHTLDHRKRGLLMAQAKREARKALREVLEDGSVVYPDSPPGVGWVLEWRGYHSKKYLRSRDEAVQHWKALTGR